MPTAAPSYARLPRPKTLRVTFELFPPFKSSPLYCHIDVLHHGHLSTIREGVAHFCWPDGQRIPGVAYFPEGTVVACREPEVRVAQGRPPAKARDIAVFLAKEHFKVIGAKKPNQEVIAVMRGGTGFTDDRAVNKECKNALKKYLGPTALAIFHYTSKTNTDDACVLALERGARVELVDGHTKRCVVHGPFWKWSPGDEEAKHSSDGEAEIHLQVDVPATWLALGQQTA